MCRTRTGCSGRGGIARQRLASLRRFTPVREPGGGFQDAWVEYASLTCGAFPLSVQENVQAAQAYLAATDVLYFEQDPELHAKDQIALYPRLDPSEEPRLLAYRGTLNVMPGVPPWEVRAMDLTWLALQETGATSVPPDQGGPANE